ncbi:TPA: L-rhamnose/proton symporter RhaT [Enterobacter hormaechei subsp. xiangfangensis]
MNHAITMGIFWHLIGAASAACFYAPFKKVKGWSWETMWSVGGTVSWLILPWTISAMLLPDFWGYFSSFNASTLLPVFLFGAMWGIGNINYGLTMRYLGFCFIRLAKVNNLSVKADFSLAKPLIVTNVLLSALGGLMWYLQFFFYAWGHASIPAQYDYMSWMLHMSFYVLCGGLVGLVLKEWNNAGRRPVGVLSLGCVVIIIAANIVGLGMAN